MENYETEVLESSLNLSENKKELSAKRTKKGFSLMALGAIILLGGCITNLIMPTMNETYNIILYGFTSVGAMIIFYGLYCVME